MIIYLVGPDSYCRGEKLRELLGQYKGKHEQTDFLDVDLDEDPTKWEGIRDFLNQPSMFVDKKIAVVRETGAVPADDGGKAWAKTLKSFVNDKNIFIIVSDSKKPRKDLSFLLEVEIHQEFPEPEGRPLEIFIKKESERRGLAFDVKALEFLSRYVAQAENRSWTAINALDMLALAGLAKPIVVADLKPFFNIAMEEEVYEIAQQFLIRGDWKTKCALLERALIEKVPDAYFFNSLAFQARGEQLPIFADMDVAIKSGNLEYEEALTSFALGA